MKTRFLSTLFALSLLVVSCKKQNEKQEENPTDTTTEVAEFRELFDGENFTGWRLYGGDEAGKAWKIEEGALVFYPPAERPQGESYNLVSEEEFTNFELSLEWKIQKNGNSGIFWGVYESEEFGQPYQTGPEIQVLDNQGHPDALNGEDRQAGALYDMVPPSEDHTNAAGEWNECILHVNHETGQGWVKMNGKLIAEFPVKGEGWENLVKESKFADWKGFGDYPKGRLGLQDHGDTVAYRKIKIKAI